MYLGTNHLLPRRTAISAWVAGQNIFSSRLQMTASNMSQGDTLPPLESINEGQAKPHLKDGLIFLFLVSLFRALLQHISCLVSGFYYTFQFHGSSMQIKSIPDHPVTIFFTWWLLVLLLGGLGETRIYHTVALACIKLNLLLFSQRRMLSPEWSLPSPRSNSH